MDKSPTKKFAWRFTSVLILLVASFGFAAAQTGSSTVNGIIQDAQGNAISGAKVILKNPTSIAKQQVILPATFCLRSFRRTLTSLKLKLAASRKTWSVTSKHLLTIE